MQFFSMSDIKQFFGGFLHSELVGIHIQQFVQLQVGPYLVCALYRPSLGSRFVDRAQSVQVTHSRNRSSAERSSLSLPSCRRRGARRGAATYRTRRLAKRQGAWQQCRCVALSCNGHGTSKRPECPIIQSHPTEKKLDRYRQGGGPFVQLGFGPATRGVIFWQSYGNCCRRAAAAAPPCLGGLLACLRSCLLSLRCIMPQLST